MISVETRGRRGSSNDLNLAQKASVAPDLIEPAPDRFVWLKIPYGVSVRAHRSPAAFEACLAISVGLRQLTGDKVLAEKFMPLICKRPSHRSNSQSVLMIGMIPAFEGKKYLSKHQDVPHRCGNLAAENLHRCDLTKDQRDRHIRRSAELIEQRREFHNRLMRNLLARKIQL